MSSRGMSPQERHRAFWDRMDRSPTIDLLAREFAREARHYGAAQSTVEAFMFSLRERGIAALAEPDTERRLSELSPAQIEQCMERIAAHQPHYSEAGKLLEDLAELIA